MVSVYIPTFRAPRHTKEKFWNDLQGCLAEIPASDKLLLFGYFNARVGHCMTSEDLWSGELCFHGLDMRNLAALGSCFTISMVQFLSYVALG